MRIMVLSGSPREQGGTRAMVKAFAEGAREAGHTVDVFNVADMNIAGCRACEFCHTRGNGECAQKDDMQQIYDEWDEMDMLVLASPIYYGSISGQLACALHRTYALGIPRKCSKTALFLCSGASGVYKAAETIYHGFVHGYFGCKDMGVFEYTTGMATSERVRGTLRDFGRSLK
ncbi:MAG: flavodoxin family protein [Coriobacteriales bacterium]|jgi:multimeric flavodoxin WrbA